MHLAYIYKFYYPLEYILLLQHQYHFVFSCSNAVRSKYFLTMHILTSIFVLGVSLIFMLIIIHSNPAHYYQQTILTPEVSLTDRGVKYVNCLMSMFLIFIEFKLFSYFFHLQILSYICVPILGLSLGTSVMLARPYHRCDCSGGEIPAGNIIV